MGGSRGGNITTSWMTLETYLLFFLYIYFMALGTYAEIQILGCSSQGGSTKFGVILPGFERICRSHKGESSKWNDEIHSINHAGVIAIIPLSHP